jgi:hypothetical protein
MAVAISAASAAQELASDQLIGLALVPSALGVPDDAPVGQPDEHLCRHLAGVRAAALGMDVLRADLDIRSR